MITTGTIIKVRFPFLDKPSVRKVRYGLVISDEHYHELFTNRKYAIVYISSQVPKAVIDGWHFIIEEGREIFESSGLEKRSIIKADRVLIVQEGSMIDGESVILGEVGKVPLSLVNEIRETAITKMFGLGKVKNDLEKQEPNSEEKG